MIEPLRMHYARVLVLLAAYLLSLLIVDPRGDFPLNDDWCYARDCIRSAQAGRPVLTGFEYAWALPQLIVGTIATKAFGFSFTTFRATGIVSLAISALLIDLYLRRVGLSSGDRLIALGAWMFNPIAYLLSLGFMTDLPFLVLWLAACYCWDMALTTEKRHWIALALIATLVVTGQRQFGLLIPIAACLLIFLRWKLGSRRLVISLSLPARAGGFEMACVIAAGVTVLFYLGVSRWYASLGVPAPPLVAGTHPLSVYLVTAYRTALFFALSSVPLLLILTKPELSRTSSRIAAGLALAAFLFGAAFLARGASPLFGNLISNFGLLNDGDVLLGRREVIFGANWRRAVDLIGLLAVLAMIRLFAGVPWARPRKVERKVERCPSEGEAPGHPGAAMGDGFGGVLMLAGALILPIFILRGTYFDRYLLPMLPSAWVALARCGTVPSRMRKIAAVVSIAAMAAFSITIAADYFRWNEARWAAAEKLERDGVPADRIQAGYEWGGIKGFDNPWPSSDVSEFDYVVSHSREIAGFKEVDAIPWKSIWQPRDRKIYVLQNEWPHDPRDRGRRLHRLRR